MEEVKPMSPEEATSHAKFSSVPSDLLLPRLFASVLLWARDEFYRYEEEMYQEREATAQDIDAGAVLTRLAEEIIKK